MLSWFSSKKPRIVGGGIFALARRVPRTSRSIGTRHTAWSLSGNTRKEREPLRAANLGLGKSRVLRCAHRRANLRSPRFPRFAGAASTFTTDSPATRLAGNRKENKHTHPGTASDRRMQERSFK